MSVRSPYTSLLLALLGLSLVAGCAPLKIPKTLTLPGQDDKPQVPQQMTALWTDTVLVEAGVVGFGGRIMFHGKDQESTMKVDGELTVFAYDDTDSTKENTIPARKFVFRADELEKHYSESGLGHSYSFWIPWGQVGGPQRQISLIARFKSRKGGVVMSEMTKHFLPGTQDPATAALASRPLPGQTPAPRPLSSASRSASPGSSPTTTVTQTSHEAQIEPAANPSRPGMTTSTITLPPRLSGQTSNAAALDARSIEQSVDELLKRRAAAQSERSEAAAEQEPEATDSADLRALTRELRAMREAMQQAEAEAAPEDRFARRKSRARIAPKLPPTRDPARLPPLPAESQSSLGP